MKKLLSVIILSICLSTTYAQHVSVQEHDVTVEKIDRSGIATFLELDRKFVEKLWKDELKAFGKVTSSKGFYYVETANIPSISQNPVRIISTVEKSNKGAMVWWTIDMGSHFVTPGEKGYSGAEDVMKQFAKKAYEEDIKEQIEDAEKARDKSVKDYENTVKDGENLQDDLKDNAQEKADLEQKLADNAENKKKLEAEVEQNKKDQVNAQKEVQQMDKAVEVVRKKLDKIVID